MSCREGKSGSYATRAEAMAAMTSIRANSDRDRLPQRVYPCTYCRAWHMTGQPKRNIGGGRKPRRRGR